MSDAGKPSKESLREVKAEFKARRKAEEQRAKDAKAYWDQQSGRASSSKGRGPLVAVGVVAAAAAVVGAGYVAKLGPFAAATSSTTASGATPTTSTASPAPTSTTPKAASPAPSPSANDDGTDPTLQAAFENTPAAKWKPGVAGLAMPKARTVGIYQPRQVADAYAKLAVYLQHVMLDPRVQFRGKLDPVLATMDGRSVSWIKKQHALFVSTHGKKGYPYSQVAVRFVPGQWRAAAATRVRGKVTAKPGPNGALELDFVYVAAYWVQPRSGGAERAIAVRIDGTTYFFGNGPRKVTRLQTGFFGTTSTAAVCGSTWKYPDYTEAWTDETQAGGTSTATAAVDPTDPDATVPDGCFINTSGF